MGVKIRGLGGANEVISTSPARWTVTTYDSTLVNRDVISDFREYTVTPYASVVADASLPAGWANADIGESDPQGSATELSGVFSISGGGPNPTNTEDAGHFVYRVVNSSVVTITARVTRPTGSQWSQVGLMVRDALGATQKRITLFVTPGDTAGHRFARWRTVTGATDSNAGNQNEVATTRWLRIQVNSGSILTFESDDGVLFTEILTGSDKSITFDDTTLFVGLYASNATVGALQSGTIDNVTVETPVNRDVVSDTQNWTAATFDSVVTPNIPPGVTITYVATNGNDNNDGTINRPLFTVDAATLQAAGNPVLVRGGTYSDQITCRDNMDVDGYPGELATFTQRAEGNDADGWRIGPRIRFYGGNGTTGAPDNQFDNRSINSVLPNTGEGWTSQFQIENCNGQSGIETDNNSGSGCTMSHMVVHRLGTPYDGVDSSFGDLIDLNEGGPKTITNYKMHDCAIFKTGHNGPEWLGSDHWMWRVLMDNDWSDEYPLYPGHRVMLIGQNAENIHMWDFLTRGVLAAGETSRSKEIKFFAANSSFSNFYMLSEAHEKCAAGAGVASSPPVTRGLRFFHFVMANGRSNPIRVAGWDDTPGLVFQDIEWKNGIFWNNRSNPFNGDDDDNYDLDIYIDVRPFTGTTDFSTIRVQNCAFGPRAPRFRFRGFSGVTNTAQDLSYWETNYPGQFSGNQHIVSDPFTDSAAGFAGTVAQAKADGAAACVTTALDEAAAGFTSSSSQIVNAGTALTTTRADGDSTDLVPVSDYRYFRPGGTGVPQQSIVIGSEAVTVVSVSQSTGFIRVSRPISFANGAEISQPYSGSAPNIGPVQ